MGCAALLAGGEAKLPSSPPAVLAAIVAEARSGALFFNLGIAAGARRSLAFTLAMTLGAAIGYPDGAGATRRNRFGDPWLILLLNLPALAVIIVLAYIWAD